MFSQFKSSRILFLYSYICLQTSVTRFQNPIFPCNEIIKSGGMESDVDTISKRSKSLNLFNRNIKFRISSILHHSTLPHPLFTATLTERLQVRERDGHHRPRISREGSDLLCSDFVLFIMLVYACNTDKIMTASHTFSTKGYIRLINCLIFRRNRSF